MELQQKEQLERYVQRVVRGLERAQKAESDPGFLTPQEQLYELIDMAWESSMAGILLLNIALRRIHLEGPQP